MTRVIPASYEAALAASMSMLKVFMFAPRGVRVVVTGLYPARRRAPLICAAGRRVIAQVGQLHQQLQRQVVNVVPALTAAFEMCVLHGLQFWPGKPLNTTQQIRGAL
ncbi:hypothetical protein GmRootV15_46540 [Variovorax sp. V15]